jgi:peroxiredoxin
MGARRQDGSIRWGVQPREAMRMGRLCAAAVVALALTGSWTHGQDDPDRAENDLKTRFATVQTSRSKAVKRYEQELRGATNDEARAAAKARFEGASRQDNGDLLDLARAHPNDSAAVRALEFVIMSDSLGSRGEAERAIKLLTRDHVRRRRMGNYCGALTNLFPSPAAEAFIRAVLQQNPDREARALACHALASLLRQQVKFSRHLRTHPDQIKAFQADHGQEAISLFLREKDPDAVEKEAETVLERVMNEFGDVRPAVRDPRALGAIAGGELNEIRHLNVGQSSQEIEGADVEGKRFKLSDFRGKVVLLVFSGEWCRPCVEMYPRERALQAKYRDKPFAIVSVNTDPSRETLRASIDAGKVSWPCWWDGGTEGPITTRWGVSGHPTVYVLDRQGVIRFKDVFGDAIDRAVASVIDEGEGLSEKAGAP